MSNFGMYTYSTEGEYKALTTGIPALWSYNIADLNSLGEFKEKYITKMADHILAIVYELLKEYEENNPTSITNNRQCSISFKLYSHPSPYNYRCDFCGKHWGNSIPEDACCDKRRAMIKKD